MTQTREHLKGIKIRPDVHKILSDRAKEEGILLEKLADEVLRAGIKVKRLDPKQEEVQS